MVRRIAIKDLTELLRDGRLYWAGGLVVVLLITALAVGWQRQRELAAERAVAEAADYSDWLAQPERHPHTAAHQGMHVFKPEPALSIVDPGINPFAGSTVWLQAHRPNELKFRPAQDATGLQRFGELSPAWVLQTLGPLLVIVLGFNAFAGEREQGTLRQTLSLGVPAVRLLWGKSLALVMALGLLAVPALVVAGVIAWDGGESLVRLAWLGLGYGVYLGIAVCVVLAVSARASSSRIALVTLLGLWIGTTLLAPRVASDLSRAWHPSPTRLVFNEALSREIDETSARVWKEHFGVTTRWAPEVPLDQWGLALQIDDHSRYPIFDRHFAQLWNTFAGQQRAQEWLGLVAPILAIRAFSMGVVGTDFASHRVFSVAAERHRRVIQDIVSEDLVAHADSRGAGHFDYAASRDLWGRVPKFEYVPPVLTVALRDSARSLSILAAAWLVAMGLAHLAVRRLVV